MCFVKKPKPPKVAPEDPALKLQIKQGLEAERGRRSAMKQERFEETLAQLGGGYGRRSLLSGGRGGAGFSAVRSLLSVG